MKKQSERIAKLWLCLAVLFGCLVAAPVSSDDDIVRAKIGIKIKSGEKTTRARAQNTVKAGDLLQVYIHPREDVYVYVIHTDGKTATLLNMTMQKVQSALLCLPSMDAFYKVDGGSLMEKITVVCSPTEMPFLSEMIDHDQANNKWAAIEQELIAKSKIVRTRGTDDDRTFEIGGTVRGPGSLKVRDPFIEDLPVYSGTGLLVRKYEFMVQE